MGNAPAAQSRKAELSTLPASHLSAAPNGNLIRVIGSQATRERGPWRDAKEGVDFVIKFKNPEECIVGYVDLTSENQRAPRIMTLSDILEHGFYVSKPPNPSRKAFVVVDGVMEVTDADKDAEDVGADEDDDLEAFVTGAGTEGDDEEEDEQDDEDEEDDDEDDDDDGLDEGEAILEGMILEEEVFETVEDDGGGDDDDDDDGGGGDEEFEEEEFEEEAEEGDRGDDEVDEDDDDDDEGGEEEEDDDEEIDADRESVEGSSRVFGDDGLEFDREAQQNAVNENIESEMAARLLSPLEGDSESRFQCDEQRNSVEKDADFDVKDDSFEAGPREEEFLREEVELGSQEFNEGSDEIFNEENFEMKEIDLEIESKPVVTDVTLGIQNEARENVYEVETEEASSQKEWEEHIEEEEQRFENENEADGENIWRRNDQENPGSKHELIDEPSYHSLEAQICTDFKCQSEQDNDDFDLDDNDEMENFAQDGDDENDKDTCPSTEHGEFEQEQLLNEYAIAESPDVLKDSWNLTIHNQSNDDHINEKEVVYDQYDAFDSDQIAEFSYEEGNNRLAQTDQLNSEECNQPEDDFLNERRYHQSEDYENENRFDIIESKYCEFEDNIEQNLTNDNDNIYTSDVTDHDNYNNDQTREYSYDDIDNHDNDVNEKAYDYSTDHPESYWDEVDENVDFHEDLDKGNDDDARIFTEEENNDEDQYERDDVCSLTEERDLDNDAEEEDPENEQREDEYRDNERIEDEYGENEQRENEYQEDEREDEYKDDEQREDEYRDDERDDEYRDHGEENEYREDEYQDEYHEEYRNDEHRESENMVDEHENENWEDQHQDEYKEDEHLDNEYQEDEYREDDYGADEYHEDEYREDEYHEDEYRDDDRDEYRDEYRDDDRHDGDEDNEDRQREEFDEYEREDDRHNDDNDG